jgi:hypothetical protein
MIFVSKSASEWRSQRMDRGRSRESRPERKRAGSQTELGRAWKTDYRFRKSRTKRAEASESLSQAAVNEAALL